MPVSRLKLGPANATRVPSDRMEILYRERSDMSRWDRGSSSGPMRYFVRRTTPRERTDLDATHVVYLCDARGRRLRGALHHFFIPKRYPDRRRHPAPTAPEPNPTPTAPDPGPDSETATPTTN